MRESTGAAVRSQAVPDSRMQSFACRLRNLPVAINGLADPAILRRSSAEKLDQLAADGHQGPVALITKGNLDTPWWRSRLRHWCRQLDLHIFASISGLPARYEPAPLEPRFRTLRAARDAGAKSIAYLRPIIPGLNDSYEQLAALVERAGDAGCHAVVSSGFRGNASVVAESGFGAHGSNEWQSGWLASVKLHGGESHHRLSELCGRRGIGFWTGTACAVAALRGAARSLSPYHIAAQFSSCSICPIRSTCAGRRLLIRPVRYSVELLRYLGYQVVFRKAASEGGSSCDLTNRSACGMHCTNCPRAVDFGIPHITLRLWNGDRPSWGDLSLARFLTGGVLCTDPRLSRKEESTVTLHPRFLPACKGSGALYATTSWMMWSEYLPRDKCFRCSYCFLSMYEEALPAPLQGTVGMSPVRILDAEPGNRHAMFCR